jgi:hypothetical protein
LLRQYHLRPAEFNAGVFASIPFPFTIEDLGGWPHAYHDVIDGFWKGSIAPQLTKEPLPKLLNGQD